MPKKRIQPSSKPQSSHDDARAEKLVIKMMGIRGGSGREDKITGFIVRSLRDAGAPDSAIIIEDPPRLKVSDATAGNVILQLPGTTRGKRRMLCAHVDTVPVCLGARPVRKGSRVVAADKDTGLGADNRAGSAVLLTTALELLSGDVPHPPVTFLWNVQEEIGLVGARFVRKSNLGGPKLVFNFDGRSPTDVIIGATGGYRMTIDVTGLASHAGGHPEDGVSAIAVASIAIAELHEDGWHGLIEKRGKVGTSNFGVIKGGVATNVVTDHVTIRAEARSHDSEFRKRIIAEIEKAFRRAAKQVRSASGRHGEVAFDTVLDYESFRLPLDTPCVEAAASAVRAEGEQPEFTIANGGLDANWLSARGLPTVTFGCGQHNIHSVNEELDLPEFHMARRIARRLIID